MCVWFGPGQPDNPGKPDHVESINQQRLLLLHKTCVIHVDPVYRAGFPSTRPIICNRICGVKRDGRREITSQTDRQTDRLLGQLLIWQSYRTIDRGGDFGYLFFLFSALKVWMEYME